MDFLLHICIFNAVKIQPQLLRSAICLHYNIQRKCNTLFCTEASVQQLLINNSQGESGHCLHHTRSFCSWQVLGSSFWRDRDQLSNILEESLTKTDNALSRVLPLTLQPGGTLSLCFLASFPAQELLRQHLPVSHLPFLCLPLLHAAVKSAFLPKIALLEPSSQGSHQEVQQEDHSLTRLPRTHFHFDTSHSPPNQMYTRWFCNFVVPQKTLLSQSCLHANSNL